MKQQLQRITKAILFCFIITLTSCEKDLYEEALEPRNELRINNVSLKKLSKSDNEKLFKKVSEVRMKRKNTLDKIVYDSINNFLFDDTNGIEIERQNGYKSYTFPIYRENNDRKVENLLFSKKLNGEYDAYIVKYDFTEEELNNFTHQELTKRKVTYTDINYTKLPKTGRLGVMCYDNWTGVSTSLYGNCTLTHSNDETCSPTTTTTWVLTSTDCYSTGGSDDNLDYSGVSTVPVTNTSNTSLEVMGITREQYIWLKVQSALLKSVISTFSAEPEEGYSKSEVIDYLMSNPEINKNLTDYLNQNNTIEAKSFAMEVVNLHIDIGSFDSEIKLPSFDPMNSPWLKKAREYAERIEKLKDKLPAYIRDKLNQAIDNSFIYALNKTALKINPEAYVQSDSYKDSQFKYNGKNAVGILLYEFANGLGADKRDFYFSYDITQQMLAGNVTTDIKNDFLVKLVKNRLTYVQFVSQGNIIQGGYSFSPDHTTVSDSFNKHVNANWVQFFIGGTSAEYRPSNEAGWIEVILSNPTSRNSLLLHQADNYDRGVLGDNRPLSTIIQRFHFKLKIN
jgi:hypothetical protein